jgi:hypothetical protein
VGARVVSGVHVIRCWRRLVQNWVKALVGGSAQFTWGKVGKAVWRRAGKKEVSLSNQK